MDYIELLNDFKKYTYNCVECHKGALKKDDVTKELRKFYTRFYNILKCYDENDNLQKNEINRLRQKLDESVDLTCLVRDVLKNHLNVVVNIDDDENIHSQIYFDDDLITECSDKICLNNYQRLPNPYDE